MLNAVRFGLVTAIHNLSLEDAKAFNAPNNRVLYCHEAKDIFVISGMDDISHVDMLLAGHQGKDKGAEAETYKKTPKYHSINNAVFRFLSNRAYRGKISSDYFTTCRIDVV